MPSGSLGGDRIGVGCSPAIGPQEVRFGGVGRVIAGTQGRLRLCAGLTAPTTRRPVPDCTPTGGRPRSVWPRPLGIVGVGFGIDAGTAQPHHEPLAVPAFAVIEQFVFVALARLGAVDEDVFQLRQAPQMDLELGIAPPGQLADAAAGKAQIGTAKGKPLPIPYRAPRSGDCDRPCHAGSQPPDRMERAATSAPSEVRGGSDLIGGFRTIAVSDYKDLGTIRVSSGSQVRFD